MARESLRLHSGTKLGRYELLAPATRGSDGNVWAARLRGARGFHKLVAIRALVPALDTSPGLERKLLEEAHVAALIQHSNVAQTLELGETEGRLYLVMEWVDGEPLSSLSESASSAGGIPLLVAVNLVAQILRGLQAAHELRDHAGEPLRIVHRELSPRTVLVTYSGTIKLVDFGLAQAMTSDRPVRLPQESEIVYRAPEQMTGGVVDQRTDLFSVGVLLYELTTGRHPFKGPGLPDLLHSVTNDEAVIPPSRLIPNYPRTLEAVVMKALEKHRDRRWPSAEEMRLALQRGVPQAFELGFEGQLRTFMADTLGQREARKREAIHRAELVVDSGLVESAAQPPSSVTSLRAIAIDSSPEQAESLAPRMTRLQSLRPLLARSVPPPHLRRPLLVLCAAGALLAFTLLWLRSPEGSRQAAVAPNSGMVELTPVRTPHEHSVPTAAASGRPPSANAVPVESARVAPAQSGSSTSNALRSKPAP